MKKLFFKRLFIVAIIVVTTLAFAISVSSCDLIDTQEAILKSYESGYEDGNAVAESELQSKYDSGYTAGKAIADGTLQAEYQKGYDKAYQELQTQLAEQYEKGYADGRAYTPSTVTLGTIGLEVHFIDVGQGDSIVLRFSDGKDYLIDAGSGTSENKTNTSNYIAYLNSIEIGQIDYLIATHAHSDHMNMLDDVLDNFEVKNVYYNGSAEEITSKYYTNFVDKVNTEQGVSVVQFDADGDIYELGCDDYKITMYAPGYETMGNNVNYTSPIILVEYSGVKILLTGDAEETEENWFLTTLGENVPDVDILKVGHHGSKDGCSDSFLSAITPEYAVISVGEENTYNHPNPFTMNDLYNAGIVTYRTNRQGNIVLKVDTEGNFGFEVENKVPIENNKYNANTKML